MQETRVEFFQKIHKYNMEAHPVTLSTVCQKHSVCNNTVSSHFHVDALPGGAGVRELLVFRQRAVAGTRKTTLETPETCLKPIISFLVL